MGRFQQGMIRFMAGRRGQDQLCVALFCIGLLFWLLSVIFGSYFLSLVSLAFWGYGIFRGFSRNIAAREIENQWFLRHFGAIGVKIRQAYVRFKNRKVYLYYRCPQCKSWLKLPRNIGEKNVTCSHCGANFNKKA